MPYFTQSGKDRESDPDQYISNFSDGSVAVFKYFDVQTLTRLGVVYKGRGQGILKVFDIEDSLITELRIEKTETIKVVSSKVNPFKKGKQLLKFVFEGKGHFDFIAFELD